MSPNDFRQFFGQKEKEIFLQRVFSAVENAKEQKIGQFKRQSFVGEEEEEAGKNGGDLLISWNGFGVNEMDIFYTVGEAEAAARI